MIPGALEDPGQTRGRAPPRPPMAACMYERLQRMSTEHGLNLSPEDILISAYLGHNLMYKPQAVDTELPKEAIGSDGGGRLSPL